MGVITYESEDASPVPAAKLFKALVLEADHLLPKIIPDVVKSIEVLEGNGGPGTVKKLAYVEDGKVNYVKHKIEEVDTVNLKTSYTVIEGDILQDKVEKISYELTYVPSPNGGSICKSITKVYTKVDFEIPEEHFQAGKERSKANLKPVEDYLLANPDL
ncbi:Major allergen d 1 [Melia azedarach]|uniref:Major allergen d 1 n=1 Tax=Melia azedarach TaxID=155640 RepID=A0ACC1YHE3_MELAZ|nr:Major allergen d 1 [Melia azedarach]